ncbi:hypothetical protein C1646_776106 [Rhizophagus diaphanus]|nr:hypothetical protein C1646_776106 [Rhizophagus diaphanus] [Rhizophagus sp. MUCL 43196]
MSGTIILDEQFNKIVPKPINNHPGYDMKYVSAYISLVAWAVSVRIQLQELLANQRFSVYHQHCLFAGFGNGKMVNSNYYWLRINKSNMAICFDCWKLVKITDIKPKKTYFSGWHRYGYEIKSEDLMKYHWDNECSKAKTQMEVLRLSKQRAYRNYKKGICYTVNLDIWYSIDGLYRPYHVLQDQLYDYINYLKHKRHQLFDRLAIARNKIQCNYIMPSAPNFEPAYISPARQEMISPTSYQSSNCKSNTSEIFISSWGSPILFYNHEKRMLFHRFHPRQRRTFEEYKAELEEENFYFCKQDYARYEQEIQDLNRKTERLENALKEKIVELKSEISTLKVSYIKLEKMWNSSDLYNFDDNMATITELANAIDGYMDNRTTTRNILIDQIKRATRQIR